MPEQRQRREGVTEATHPETEPAPPAAEAPEAGAAAQSSQRMVLDELLVEDVSIDGMCGVY